MNWLFKLLDASGTNQAVVDANGSVKTTGPTTLSQTGFTAVAGRNDDGVTTGTARVKRIYVTEAGQGIKTAQPIILFDDTFNATAQNTAKWYFEATTQTGAQAGGFLLLNNSAVTTINTNSGIRTFRSFPLMGKSELRCTISLMLTQVPQANNLIEFGLFTAVMSTRVAPTDGVFFRYNASAQLLGVISYAGVETTTAAISAPSASVTHDYTIVTTTDEVIFYIDGVCVGNIALISSAPTQGQPFQAASQPITIRTYHGGSAPALATQVKVTDVFVTMLGPEMTKAWPEIKAGHGHMAYQGQNGGTMGSTANYANSANNAAAVPTNTTAALGSGLGGQFWETNTLAANADGIIQSFQNPVGSATQTPRNLIIYGLTYQCYNQVAMATVAFNKQVSLAFGHTAVSLATADTASFTSVTTKAPRRIALGVIQPVAAVNTVYPVYSIQFTCPIVIAPGEFVALVSKSVGTVPATGVCAWMINYDAVFE